VVVTLVEIVVVQRIAQVKLRLGLLRHQACLQLARKVANLVLPSGTRGGVVRVAQPQAQLHQGRRQLPAQAQAQHQRQRQQDQAE